MEKINTNVVEEINDTPEEQKLTMEEKEMQYKKDLKTAVDAVKEVNSLMASVDSFVQQTLSNYNIKDGKKLLYHLAVMDEETIRNMKYDDVQNLLKYNDEDKDALGSSYMKMKDHSETLLEFSINALLGLREMEINRKEISHEKFQFLKDVKQINDDYEKYRLSDVYEKDRQATLKSLKESASKIESDYQRKKILTDIEVIETSGDSKFLLDRLVNGDSEKEITSAINAFFDKRRSSELKVRFKTKAKKFNITAPMYRSFFNLEEKYMDEKYHPYNNFFLFYIVRYIVHCDPYNKHDKNRVEALMLRLIRLVDDRFNEEDKAAFIHFIEGFYIYVITKERTEMFKEKNETYKNHPARMKIHTELIDQLKDDLGPTFKEEYTNEEEAVLRETLFRIQQSKIVMVTDLYKETKDMKWMNNVYKFYEIEEEYNKIFKKKEEPGEGEEAEEAPDDSEITTDVSES